MEVMDGEKIQEQNKNNGTRAWALMVAEPLSLDLKSLERQCVSSVPLYKLAIYKEMG